MSRSGALARARSLREALLDHGVRKVSIELQQGRPGTPNDRWYDTRFVAEMSHHTVSRPSNGNTPCLSLVKRGRSDVPGPLCNGYMGYDLVYRIICMGWANHPGAGGPLTVAGYRIPHNVARPYAWGTEFEGGLEPWKDDMHEAMARSNAGILDWIGRPLSAHIEHSSWTSRKIDRLNYTATSGRNRIEPFMGGGVKPTPPKKEWDEMASEKQVQSAVENGTLATLQSAEGRDAISKAITIGLRHDELGDEMEKLLVGALANAKAQKLLGNAVSGALRDGRVARREVQELIELSTTGNPDFAAWLTEVVKQADAESEQA